MARIRSVHPGLFTDEAFVSVSSDAQILLIGIYTECDDQGAFEWNPVKLRLRLRSNKDGSVEPMLAELEAFNIIRSYEHNGRKLGVVRNFTKYQHPKKPNSVYFIPPELRTYVSTGAASSVPHTISDTDSSVPHITPDTLSPEPIVDDSPTVPHQTPLLGELKAHQPTPILRNEELALQRERRGEKGRGREERNIPEAARPSLPRATVTLGKGDDRLEKQLREAAGWQSEPAPMLAVTGAIQALLDDGADLEIDVLPVVRAIAPRARSRTTWKYFIGAITEAKQQRTGASQPRATANGGSNPDERAVNRLIGYTADDSRRPDGQYASIDDARWTRVLAIGRSDHAWDSRHYGPIPGQHGCRVPEALMQPGDGIGWSEWKPG